MNPFLYSALIILCLCGTSTVPLLISYRRDRGLPMAGLEFLLIYPIWAVSACMLAAIALASRTGTGVGLALVGGLVLGLTSVFAMYVRLITRARNVRSRPRR